MNPASSLTRHLLLQYLSGSSVSVTWLNHYSAPIAFRHPDARLEEFDVVGIDGKLLQFIVGATRRTSADLVLPALLPQLEGARVAILGGEAGQLVSRSEAVSRLLSNTGEVVLALNGYEDLPAPGEFAATVRERGANVVLVGLGAGLQEEYAIASKAGLARGGVVVTCGGFLDQLLVDGYYPTWAYPLRLNWLVRLAREPRRLWKRYTVDALAAWLDGRRLHRNTRSLPGLWS